MRKFFGKIMNILNNRYFILSAVIVIVAIVFIWQLFNIQILNGKEYREQSEKRMLRTEKISAPRGEMYDRNGIVLATSKLSFNAEIYKVRVDVEKQNSAIATFINILESNNDKIYSTFPVKDDFSGFTFDNPESEKKWKNEMKVDVNLDFNKTIDYYIQKYGLESYNNDRNLQIKIIKVKYEANLNAYSLFNSALIAKDISEKSVAQIEEKKSELYGINTISVPKRYYPNGEFLSHTLGYVSKIGANEYNNLKNDGYNINSNIGKAGLEQSFEKYLKGIDGIKKVETDSKGNISSENTTVEPVSGNNVTLTIDYRLQKVAEESLLNAINGLKDGSLVGKKFSDANAGAVVVLDVISGEVLALANYPTYDINAFVGGITNDKWNAIINDPVKPMLNRCISGTYSPGSTYKMLVGLAGLKTGKITLEEKIQDPGVYPYGHKPMCWKYSTNRTTHGWVNLSEAIKGSCNCFFYEVGRRIGIDEIVNYSKIFGLGSKTGIELSQEVTGQIAGADKSKQWYFGDTLSAAIGQSYNLYTPIQLANYISALSNGGKLNKVSVIKDIKNESANSQVSVLEIEEHSKKFTGVDFKPTTIDINKEYIDSIKEGMLSVTSEVGGTSYITFKNSNIEVAGKTGTAQVPSGSNNGIFVGFAPYDNPKIAVVAIIEHGGEGSYTAKVVKPIMEEYFNISSQDKANEKDQNVVESGIKF